MALNGPEIGATRSPPRILRVRVLDAAGRTEEHDYHPDLVPMVWDTHPVVEFLVQGGPLVVATRLAAAYKKSLRRGEPSGGEGADTAWQPWALSEILTGERRLGHH